MTKIQQMELRIKEDDKMCLRINKILDELYKGERGYPEATGAICACLQTAGRRKEKDQEIKGNQQEPERREGRHF